MAMTERISPRMFLKFLQLTLSPFNKNIKIDVQYNVQTSMSVVLQENHFIDQILGINNMRSIQFDYILMTSDLIWDLNLSYKLDF